MRPDSLLQLGKGIAARIVPSDGEKVLWIHGYTLDSSIWHDLWSYLPDWYHIGIDLPGHGASERMTIGEDLGALARRIGELALEHGVRHLVGLSFGGMVALQIASEMPNAFASLVLGSPGLGSGPYDRYAQAKNLELMYVYSKRGAGPWLTELWMKSPPDIFKGAAKYPQLWKELHEVVDRHSWLELRETTMQALTNYPQTEKDLQQIKAATLLLIGEEDMAAFKRCGELIQRTIPACKRIYLPNVGHLGLLEAASKVHTLIDSHFYAVDQDYRT